MRFLRWISGRLPDVEQELDEEFAFHIQERFRQFREQGASDAEAELLARRAFGDVARYRAEAAMAITAPLLRRRILMTAASCSVAACVLSCSVTLVIAARREASAVGALRADLERLRQDLAPFRGDGGIPLAQQVRFVTVRGAVRNPRVWTVPQDIDVTLRSLIAKSGGLTPAARGDITLTAGSGSETPVKTITAPQWQDPDHADIRIAGFMTIDVR